MSSEPLFETSNTHPDRSDRESVVATLWRSPWTMWVGFRYLRSKKHNRFMSLITLISVAGICIGVTAMLVVMSVMEGFEEKIKSGLVGADLHILITPTQSLPGFDQGYLPQKTWDEKGVVAALNGLGDGKGSALIGAWPIVSTEAILKTGRKVTGIVLKGVNDERLSRLKTQVIEMAEPQMLVSRDGDEVVKLPGIFLGQDLAFDLGAIPGDFVTLVSPTETEGPLSSVPRVKRFVVEGIYRAGSGDQELQTAFATESAVRSYLRKAGVLSSIEVSLKNFDEGRTYADELKKKLPGFRVQDWSELNSHLFASLKLERAAMFVVLALIVVVASFNIVTTLTLMVLEKKRDIAILRTMGAKKREVAAIFLSEGILIGFGGIFGGVVLGLGICGMLRRYEFLIPDVYTDRTLPVSFRPEYYVLIAVVAAMIVLAACLYPSRRAADLRPLDGLRS